MENATKALIIAAAVLVTIVIVALGVLLISNVSDSSGEAEKVGDAIGDATQSAISGIQGDLNPRDVSAVEFNNDFMKMVDETVAATNSQPNRGVTAITSKNAELKEWERIKIKGYFYYSNTEGKDLKTIETIDSYLRMFENPTEDITNKLRTFRDKCREENGFGKAYIVQTIWRYGYDSAGYINLAEYIVGFGYE